MKCPFCNEELELDEYDLYCKNCSYNKNRCLYGNEEMWKELTKTKQALDIAVDALKDNLSQANFTQMLDASRFHVIRTKCEYALDQITALEQKGEQNERRN